MTDSIVYTVKPLLNTTPIKRPYPSQRVLFHSMDFIAHIVLFMLTMALMKQKQVTCLTNELMS